MTLQLLHSEFPYMYMYMREKNFYQCKCFYIVFVLIRIALGCIPKTQKQLAAKWR
jgi:hypothetical protein